MEEIETARPKIQQTRWLAVGLLMLTAAGALVLFYFQPATAWFYPPCPFQFLTGYYCPGCGTLRGLNHLLHGDIAGAFGSNALMVLSLPFMVYALGGRLVMALIGRPYRPIFLPAWASRAILWLVVIYSVLRNIPVHPFNLLAP